MIRAFVTNVVQQFEPFVSEDGVRIAVVTYHSTARIVFNFQELKHDLGLILQRVDDLDLNAPANSATLAHTAFKLIREELFVEPDQTGFRDFRAPVVASPFIGTHCSPFIGAHCSSFIGAHCSPYFFGVFFIGAHFTWPGPICFIASIYRPQSPIGVVVLFTHGARKRSDEIVAWAN